MVECVLNRVGVVIPVHNEALLIRRCLTGLADAAAQCSLPVSVVLVLDRCTDDTEAIALDFDGLDVQIARSARAGVGAARATGVQTLLGPRHVDELWLATTDADSVVPPHWLTAQLAHAAAGAAMVIGTVTVDDWIEQSPTVETRYLAGYHGVNGHRHMHGANLSFRARAYLTAGGFDDRDHDEDVELIRRFERTGQSLVWAADLPVITSGRRVGRAPHGFAAHLLSLEDTP